MPDEKNLLGQLPPLKPGFKTSEFWVVVLTILGSLGLGTGSFLGEKKNDPKQGQEASSSTIDQVIHKLTPIAAIVASLLVSNNFANRRTELKKEQSSAGEQSPTASAPPPATPAAQGPGLASPIKSGSFRAADNMLICVREGLIVQIGDGPH